VVGDEEKGGGGGRVMMFDQEGPGGSSGEPQGGGEPGMGGEDHGDGHDPNLRGDPTRLAAKRRAVVAQGVQGAGPSRSETILGSAEKGFATAAYKRVYGDYSAVVEEVMSKEQVPPGYRFYVKRYFQLIKPRE